MRRITYCNALNEAMHEEMARDDRVFIIGEDIDLHGGVFNLTEQIIEEFGPMRCVGTPISEEGFMGMAAGAAATGLKPVVEIMYIDFLLMAMDPAVNQIPKMHYMSGGQVPMNVTIRAQSGHGTAEAAQHSQSFEAWFMHTPGIKVCMPATVYDAKGLLKAAIRDDNPVLFIENRVLFYEEEEVPEGEWIVPLGKADVAREGSDVTVIATAYARRKALAAAEALEGEISVEVIDPRSLVPLDMETILESVSKTGRVMVVHESPTRCGLGAEIVRRIVAEGFDYLDAAPVVHAAANVPTPFSPPLEKALLPQTETIVREIKKLVG